MKSIMQSNTPTIKKEHIRGDMKNLKYKIRDAINKNNLTPLKFPDLKFVINENTIRSLNENIKCYSNLKGHVTLLDLTNIPKSTNYYTESTTEYDIISVIKNKNERLAKKKLEDYEFKKKLDEQVADYDNKNKDIPATELPTLIEENDPNWKSSADILREDVNDNAVNTEKNELTTNQKKINNFHEQLMNMKTNNKTNRRIMKYILGKFKLIETDVMYFELSNPGMKMITNEHKVFYLYDNTGSVPKYPPYILLVGELKNKTAFIENLDQGYNKEERLRRQEEFVDKVKKIEEQNKEII